MLILWLTGVLCSVPRDRRAGGGAVGAVCRLQVVEGFTCKERLGQGAFWRRGVLPQEEEGTARLGTSGHYTGDSLR